MIAVLSPTAGANDLTASSRSYALQLNSTASNLPLTVSAWTTGGFFSVTSPFGLLMTSPAEASSEARRGRTRKVTSRPACSSLPPKYPPMAPAPTTKTRIPELPLFTKSVATNELAREKPATIALASPFFAERPNFKLKSPGAARLLVELPVGGRDRGGRHQQIRVVERF